MTLAFALKRLARPAAAALLLATAMPAGAADPAPFDLPGPGLTIQVTRGGKTLPIGQVPGLAAGDTLRIAADLPEDQRAHFLLLSAFLNGATNPPPKDWIHVAETWKSKDKDRLLTLTVPEGARQMVLFLVPDTNGAYGTIADAVRGRPGEFVRATQELNQASLDRARLNAFMTAIRTQENAHPEYLKSIAPKLAQSLAMKLNEDCLARVIDQQAACLLQNQDSLVLADVHTSSMAETLIGAPTDLALQLSYTREGGLGYYSPYIAVVRDIARVFGAFSNPQLNYLPTLSQRQGAQVSLLLNTAPSFSKPKSVLVAGMPTIGTDTAPRLHAATDQPICGARPNLVLPVEGAPLIYATEFARDMALTLTPASGAPRDVPVTARADRGGYVVTQGLAADAFRGSVKAHLHGNWGFDRFDGPDFTLQFPGGGDWRVGKDAPSLVVGRDNVLTLTGPAPSCLDSITVRRGDAAPIRASWKPAGEDAISLTLPLAELRPGELTLEIRQFGAAAPATLSLRAYEQASRLERLEVHAGDGWGLLSGQRLDLVESVELNGVRFRPDGLTREGKTDRLRIAAADGATIRAGTGTARVALSDGRTLTLPVSVAAARPQAKLLAKDAQPRPGTTRTATLLGDDALPDDSRLVFSLRAEAGTRFTANDAIEVTAAENGPVARITAAEGLKLQGPDVLVATFDPAALGASTFGPLRYRLVQGEVGSDWQKLTTLVRLPQLGALTCAKTCTLAGRDLFLVDAVSASASFDKGVAVPPGFTGATLAVPLPQDGKLYLRLRDDPGAVLAVDAPVSSAP